MADPIQDPYAVLGMKKTASGDEIRRRAELLATHHQVAALLALLAQRAGSEIFE